MSTDEPTPPPAPDYGAPPPSAPGGGYGAPPPPPPAGGYGTPPPAYGAAAPLPGGLVPAQWVQRFLAYLIDFIAPVVVIYIVIIVFTAINDTLGALIGVVLWLAMLAWLIYNYGIKQGTTGYTLGKGMIGIKLVDANTGQPVGTGMAIARWFVHILDSIPCIPVGFLWPLWDPRRETFADKILKHAVVVADKVDPKSFIPEQFNH